jgi:hypothetical protein
LAPKRSVWKHKRKPLINGGFAVPKDDDEDRFISYLVQCNSLLDPSKIPRPRFAYTPRLHVVRTTSGGIIYIHKRDARHYFRNLRVGERWRKFLCHPPLPSSHGSFIYPLRCAAGVGFSPSSGWAQALTDTCATHAALPVRVQVHMDRPCPPSLP